MMLRILAPIATWILIAGPLQAQNVARLDELVTALGLPQMLKVIQQEGLDYGDELGQEMFPLKAGDSWQQQVALIYDYEHNRQVAFDALGTAIDPAQIDDILNFFQSPVGAEIIALEVAARAALMDDDLSDANDLQVAALRKQETSRMGQLGEFIQVNDLLELNVVGALNSNFAFFNGLVDGGAYEQPLSEDKILQEVWSQEASIREDTEVWLYGFLSMAYSPLDDADMQALLVFSETPAGQHINHALFEAFHLMFDEISYSLGLAAAQQMKSEAL